MEETVSEALRFHKNCEGNCFTASNANSKIFKIPNVQNCLG